MPAIYDLSHLQKSLYLGFLFSIILAHFSFSWRVSGEEVDQNNSGCALSKMMSFQNYFLKSPPTIPLLIWRTFIGIQRDSF